MDLEIILIGGLLNALTTKNLEKAHGKDFKVGSQEIAKASAKAALEMVYDMSKSKAKSEVKAKVKIEDEIGDDEECNYPFCQSEKMADLESKNKDMFELLDAIKKDLSELKDK